MKRIAFISHASLLNGAPISLAELAGEFLKQSNRLQIHFGLPTPGKVLERCPLAGANPFYYARTFQGREILVTKLRVKRRLKKIFVQKKIDLVVANTLESFRAVEAAFELDLPSIWMIRELLTTYQERKELEEIKKSAGMASRLIFNSRTAIKMLPILGEGLKKRARVIYNGITLPSKTELEKDFRLELELGLKDTILGSVGDICPFKGYESLLQAFKLVSQQVPGAKLIIIGRVPSQFERFYLRLKKLNEDLGMGEKALFLGERSDVLHWMNSLNVFIHPSWRESFGRVVIEALAREKPVVATRSGGVEEIIEEGETGLLVPPRQPQALARAILWVLTHREEAREMGRRGIGLVREKFSLARSASEIKQEIEDLL